MSAAAAAGGSSGQARAIAAAPVRALVPALAVQEARRLLLHPLSLLGFGIYVVATLSTVLPGLDPRSAFETTTMALTFYPGVLLILVGNLLATRDHRSGAEEMLGPVPGRREERVKAIALASLAPAVVGLCLALGVRVLLLMTDQYAPTSDAVPSLWHLLGGPVTLSGACLFGLMLGVWSSARVTPVVGVVAIVAANVWVDSRGELRLLGPAFGWARWGNTAEDWAGVYAGSPLWHVVYLAALAATAFAAAWFRTAARRVPVAILAVLCLAGAVGAGLLQMTGGPR
jgi:hypothetical protein